MSLRGTRYLTGCWPLSVEGRAIELRQGARRWKEPCDYVACGFGLVPDRNCRTLLGCALREGFVQVNEWQETSVSGIYCAGEPMGIGGVDLALTTGQIAGHHAGGRSGEARRLFGARASALRFKDELHRAFSLCDDLKSLPSPETLVCRCEDVPALAVFANTPPGDQPSSRPAAVRAHVRAGFVVP